MRSSAEARTQLFLTPGLRLAFTVRARHLGPIWLHINAKLISRKPHTKNIEVYIYIYQTHTCIHIQIFLHAVIYITYTYT